MKTHIEQPTPQVDPSSCTQLARTRRMPLPESSCKYCLPEGQLIRKRAREQERRERERERDSERLYDLNVVLKVCQTRSRLSHCSTRNSPISHSNSLSSSNPSLVEMQKKQTKAQTNICTRNTHTTTNRGKLGK